VRFCGFLCGIDLGNSPLRRVPFGKLSRELVPFFCVSSYEGLAPNGAVFQQSARTERAIVGG
jgi:hypothetical protein